MRFFRGGLNDCQHLVVALLLLTGCAVGPNYKTPEYQIDSSYIHQPKPQSANKVELDWWQALNDEQLQSLIEYSLKHNARVKIALARLQEARTMRRIARSAFYPKLQAGGSYTRYELSTAAPGAVGQLVNAGAIARDDNAYASSIDVGWELDLFGGTRRKSQAATGAIEAITADYNAVILALIAEIGSAYFEYMGIERHLHWHQRQLELHQQREMIVNQQQQLGLSGKLDVLQNNVQLSVLQSQFQQLKAAHTASLYRLGQASAQTPQQITASTQSAMTATLPQNIEVGSPADLLKRRPDLISTERRLAAAVAEIGVAKAEFFPKLVINASYGFEAESGSDLGSSIARTTGIIPSISWNIFSGGQLAANLKRSKIQVQAATARYEGTLLLAISEAETALNNYDQSLLALENINQAKIAARQATDIANKLHKNGMNQRLQTIATELQQIGIERQQVDTEIQTFIKMVQLYKSLGGSW